MAILHADKVVFYHPCDSLTDGDSNVWTSPDPDGFWTDAISFPAGGVLGGNMAKAAGGGGFSSMADPGHGNMLGATRMTVARWMKDPFDSGSFVGFDGGGGGPIGSLQALQLWATGVVWLWAGVGSPTVTWGSGTVGVITGSTWHFYVLDVVRSGGDWILRHSVDGAPFTVETGIAGAAFVESPSHAVIEVTSTTGVDEVVLWRDLAAPFTATELQNLFDLADTFGDPMNQYTETFQSAPICWQATAIMPNGAAWMDSGPGPCPPVIRVPKGANDIVVTDDGKPIAPRVIEG